MHLNTSMIFGLWFNYFNWNYTCSYTHMNQKSRRVRERTREKEQSYFKGVFVEATITGRNNEAAEYDNDDR